MVTAATGKQSTGREPRWNFSDSRRATPLSLDEFLAEQDPDLFFTGKEPWLVGIQKLSWQTFFRVTLPNVKWALLYGVILCNARAMGEFGAVSVVSGHIRGLTNTMPLHIEILYNDYQFVPAFAVASLLAFLALITLVVKSIVEWRASNDLRELAKEESES